MTAESVAIVGSSAVIDRRYSSFEPFDLGAHGAEFFFDLFVTAIEMVNAIDDRNTVGNEGRNYKRRARAKVRGNDGCGAEARFSGYDCARAINTDVCAHAQELAGVHEAILEDVLGDGGSIEGLSHER